MENREKIDIDILFLKKHAISTSMINQEIHPEYLFGSFVVTPTKNCI